MAVICNRCGVAIIKDVETAGGGLCVIDEAGKPRPDNLPIQSKRPAGTGCRHCIFDLETDGAIGSDRDFRKRNAVFEAAFRGDDGVTVKVDDALCLVRDAWPSPGGCGRRQRR